MYIMKRMDWGIHTRFTGRVSNDDMQDWLEEATRLTAGWKGKFAMLLDFRACDYLGDKAKQSLDLGRRIFFRRGMRRSVIVFREAKMARGFRHAAIQMGYDDFERYICPAMGRVDDLAMDWLLYAKDPGAPVAD
ncbi:MAG: hypothetical protein R3C71_07080 [Candidatus Krumholzibacteriia bacterium]|nr:hypothetical protein [bacterium]MCB9517168.1 hypothetical protein [Candidatus Latescibacterota bacterium]